MAWERETERERERIIKCITLTTVGIENNTLLG
jgi:hypothetical protein